jgi:hypothetical protein
MVATNWRGCDVGGRQQGGKRSFAAMNGASRRQRSHNSRHRKGRQRLFSTQPKSAQATEDAQCLVHR